MLDWSKQYFETNGMDSPQLDAQLLLGHVLKMSKMQLLLNAERPLDAEELADYKKLVIRRAKNREPIAYILGEKGFWSLNLKVTPDVLIPRPDTECLVEKAIDFANAWMQKKLPSWCSDSGNAGFTYESVDDRKAYYDNIEASDALEQKTVEWLENSAERLKDLSESEKIHEFQLQVIENKEEKIDLSDSEKSQNRKKMRIVDIGTGSGAIILAIASELDASKTDLMAVDISPKALEIARQNAQDAGFAERVSFVESDLLSKLSGEADLIVSNPPYVSTSEMAQLDPEVKKEPVLALEAGRDGLDVYKRLVPQAVQKLTKTGALIVEIGCTQADAVEAIFKANGLKNVRTFKDYGKQPRVVFGMK